MPTDQMQVQVKNYLTGMGTGVDNQAVAGFLDAFLAGNLASNREKMPHELLVSRLQIVGRFDMPVRDDQHVSGGNGMDIPESSCLVVSVHFVTRGFSPDDFAKYTIGGWICHCGGGLFVSYRTLSYRNNSLHPACAGGGQLHRGDTIPQFLRGLGVDVQIIIRQTAQMPAIGSDRSGSFP